MTALTESQKSASRVIKALPSSAVVVLLSMGILGGVNIGNQQIKKFSGLSYPTVKEALEDNLEIWGLVINSGSRVNAWHLSDGGRLILEAVNNMLLEGASQKVFDSLASSSINKDTNIQGETKKTTTPAPSQNLFDYNPKNWTSSFNPAADLRGEADPEILKVLNRAGIYSPIDRQLARVKWLDLEGAKNWAAAIEAGEEVPKIVYRIRHKWDPPAARSNGHLKTCTCLECQDLDRRKKYKL